MDTKQKELPNFWQRLKTFIENVQVNDQPSEEEKQMILKICDGWIIFRQSQQNELDNEKVIYANQKLVEFVNFCNYDKKPEYHIPNSWIGKFNLNNHDTQGT